MFKCNKKFDNLEEELFELPEVLKNSLQNEVLDIKQLNKESEKFEHSCELFPALRAASYVVYSKFMKKEFHENESFIFVDKKGATLCTLSGRELDLYDMIEKCEKLKENKLFK